MWPQLPQQASELEMPINAAAVMLSHIHLNGVRN
jgi:hypothetical protein